MRQDIQKMLQQADSLKDKKIKHLVDVYSNMKAQQAANVIETMDQDLAVKILSGMRGRQAGEILTYVKPEKAAKLSEELTTLQVPFQNN
jgi:flagellar motility protein MotE (MotC chaperone)